MTNYFEHFQETASGLQLVCARAYHWYVDKIQLCKRYNYELLPADNFMFEVNNRNTRIRWEICSKLTIKIPEQRHWRCSIVFIVNFKYFTSCSGSLVQYKHGGLLDLRNSNSEKIYFQRNFRDFLRQIFEKILFEHNLSWIISNFLNHWTLRFS